MKTQPKTTKEVLRFAHPFFTPKPINERPDLQNGTPNRLTSYIKTQLQPIPNPIRDNPTMQLAEIIGDDGVAGIVNAGALIFHATGDTGMETGNTTEMVADAMTGDYDISSPATTPAFLFHLGDVDYYNNTDEGYHAQFYVHYKNYPGKIIAIPGNHDGELFKWDGTSTGQKTTLQEFQLNFCQSKTGIYQPAAGTIYREMISQPAVYWYLNTPFADIIGLYSNMAENPGYISSETIGSKQKDWLTQTLKNIKNGGQRKALFIATHHPPLSTGSHSSSVEMMADIDDSCSQAGVMPDVFLSAHSHNIQTYTRYVTFNGKDLKIPYIVCGGGGRTKQAVPAATQSSEPDATALPSTHTFDSSISSYGYLKITAKKDEVIIDIKTVDDTGVQANFSTINVPIV